MPTRPTGPDELQYRRQCGEYAALAQEIQYLLSRTLAQRSIPIANISWRVKSFESFTAKVLRKRYDHPFDQCTDLVGARVVCLFPDDIDRVAAAVRSVLDVKEVVDKRPTEPDRFRYDALHMVVAVNRKNSGSRARDFASLRCEIQIRSLLQDAWATAEHSLRYKSDQPFPQRLNRQLHELNAVLSSAETQLNALSRAKRSYAAWLGRSSVTKILNESVNGHSVPALLKKRFPGRPLEAYRGHLEVVMRGLDLQRFATLRHLDQALSTTERVRRRYARDLFSGVALAHLALALACLDTRYRGTAFFGEDARRVIRHWDSTHKARRRPRRPRRTK